MSFLFTLLDIYLLILSPLYIIFYEIKKLNSIIKGRVSDKEFEFISDIIYYSWIVLSIILLEDGILLLGIIFLSLLSVFFKKYKKFAIIDTLSCISIIFYIVITNLKYF